MATHTIEQQLALHALARARQQSLVTSDPAAVSVYTSRLTRVDQRALVMAIQPGTVESSGNRWLFSGMLLGRMFKIYLAQDDLGHELAIWVGAR